MTRGRLVVLAVALTFFAFSCGSGEDRNPDAGVGGCCNLVDGGADGGTDGGM